MKCSECGEKIKQNWTHGRKSSPMEFGHGKKCSRA